MTVTLLQALLPADAMESYGWRIPFLLAAPLGLVGLYIRLRLDDTPQFAELSKAQPGGGDRRACGLAMIEAVYVSTAVAAGVELFATRAL